MNPVQWAAALGFVAPLVSSVINQQHWSTQVKQIVALVVAVVLGAIGVLISGADLSWNNFAAVLAVAVGISQAAYAAIWKPIGVAPKIEAATPGAPVSAEPVPVVIYDEPGDADDAPVVQYDEPSDSV